MTDMSKALEATPGGDSPVPGLPERGDLTPWWLALAGALALFAPVYWRSANGIWGREEYAHAPIILALAAWLAWRLRDKFLIPTEASRQFSPSGWVILVFGLLVFLLGNVLTFSVLEFSAQPLIALGAIVLCGGWQAARTLWFPIFFLIFMIPLPGAFVDAATGALKQWVSVSAESVLALARYPVGRQGVMLTVGNYQLLVADACSGLHSMFTLTAMGTLMLYIKERTSKLHQLIMLSLILPIAFVANVIRVLALVLITYHLGDEAGQGFLHGTAGIVLIIVAMLTFVLVDEVLAMILKRRR